MKTKNKLVKKEADNIFAAFDVILVVFASAIILSLIATRLFELVIVEVANSVFVGLLALIFLLFFSVHFSAISMSRVSVIGFNYLFGNLSKLAYALLIVVIILSDGVLLAFYHLKIDFFLFLIIADVIIFITFYDFFIRRRRQLKKYETSLLKKEIENCKTQYFSAHYTNEDYAFLLSKRKGYLVSLFIYIFTVATSFAVIPTFIYSVYHVFLYFLLLKYSLPIIRTIYKTKHVRYVIISTIMYFSITILVALLINNVIDFGEDLRGNMMLMCFSGLGFMHPYIKLQAVKNYVNELEVQAQNPEQPRQNEQIEE